MVTKRKVGKYAQRIKAEGLYDQRNTNNVFFGSKCPDNP